ncbi:unnamed protein product [Pleuronectes platessa]|uniref:Uncharacterized protein n=1 Tax=Pleuronectes platessa TaxID=8262 RepID=A0A9N7VRW8_PLEPL|nr:unnamed protein product [Pleuronectes platessa]
MDADTRSYVAAGLLHPLSVPNRPWSHSALDFVMGCHPHKLYRGPQFTSCVEGFLPSTRRQGICQQKNSLLTEKART